jgi:hypothetical protein
MGFALRSSVKVERRLNLRFIDVNYRFKSAKLPIS